MFLFVQMNPDDISEDISDEQILSQLKAQHIHSESEVNPRLSLAQLAEHQGSRDIQKLSLLQPGLYQPHWPQQYKKGEIDASQWCHGG